MRGLCDVVDVSSPTESALAVRGEFDAACADEFGAAVDAVLARPDVTPEIVVDMSGVGFMDSAGLAALLAAHRRAEASGHRLWVREPTAHAQRVLETAGVADLLVG